MFKKWKFFISDCDFLWRKCNEDSNGSILWLNKFNSIDHEPFPSIHLSAILIFPVHRADGRSSDQNSAWGVFWRSILFPCASVHPPIRVWGDSSSCPISNPVVAATDLLLASTGKRGGSEGVGNILHSPENLPGSPFLSGSGIFCFPRF